MPYGVSWTRYISFMTVALVSTLSGAQVVHNIYRPLDDVNELVEEELKKRLQQK